MKSLNLFILFIAITCVTAAQAKKDRDKEEIQNIKTGQIHAQTLEMVPVNRSLEWLKFLWNGGTSVGMVIAAYMMLAVAKRAYFESQHENLYDSYAKSIYFGGSILMTQALLDCAYNKYILSLKALKKAWDGFGYTST